MDNSTLIAATFNRIAQNYTLGTISWAKDHVPETYAEIEALWDKIDTTQNQVLLKKLLRAYEGLWNRLIEMRNEIHGIDSVRNQIYV